MQNLDRNIQIVNEDGTPSQYFMRMLQTRGLGQEEIEILVAALEISVTGLLATEMIAGFGLSGGGNLSADRTFDLDAILDNLTDVDTVTTPPTNNQLLSFRSSDGLWVPRTVSGGSGAIGVAQPIQPDSTVYSGSLFAAKGNIITARRDIVINTVATRFGTTADYRLIIAVLNGSDVIQSIPYTGASVSRTGTQMAYEVLSTALPVASGTRIGIMWVIQGGTPTTPATNAFPNEVGLDGFGWTFNSNIRWADNNPAIGETALGTGTGFATGMELLYSV